MVWYGMVLKYGIALHGMVWSGVVCFRTVWLGMVVWQGGMAWWHGMVGMAWHGMDSNASASQEL